MSRRRNNFVTRLILFIVAAGSLLALLSQWGKLPGSESDSPEPYIKSRLAELARSDPHAAQVLQKLHDQRDARDLAVAMKAAERGGGNESSALRMLASRAATEQTPFEIQLSALARKSFDPDDAQRAAAFFDSHATACQMLVHDKSGEAMKYYLDLLNAASKQPDVWRVVRDDPVGLILWRQLTQDSRVWQYYEAERDWLANVLADLGTIGNADASAHERHYADAVRAATQFDPLPKKAVQELKLGSHGFALFLAYGPIIRHAVTDLGVPLEEILEVLFINGDGLALPDDEPLRSQKAQQFAAELAQIRKSRPKVWAAARNHPLALRLNKDVPAYADQLLEKYGPNDVCAFLYTNYEDALVPAAAAIARFGDLGFWALQTYHDDKRLNANLKNPQVGILVVPFLARFGNAGFDKLQTDTAWATRYFNPDGTPRKDDLEWIQSVPIVGAPTVLVRNLVKGYPSEWSEWGWAALDVADGALLVASFGSSAGVSAGKQALKEGGKASIETLAKQEAKALARRGAREAAEAALKQGGKSALRESALRRLVKSGGRVLRASGECVLVAGRVVGKIAEPAFAAARQLRTAWGEIPPAGKRWIYRSLLAVGMIITIHERTIPGLPKIGEAIGTEAGRLIANGFQGIANALVAALREVMGRTPLGKLLGYWGGYILSAFVLIALAWRVAPWRQSAVQVR